MVWGSWEQQKVFEAARKKAQQTADAQAAKEAEEAARIAADKARSEEINSTDIGSYNESITTARRGEDPTSSGTYRAELEAAKAWQRAIDNMDYVAQAGPATPIPGGYDDPDGVGRRGVDPLGAYDPNAILGGLYTGTPAERLVGRAEDPNQAQADKAKLEEAQAWKNAIDNQDLVAQSLAPDPNAAMGGSYAGTPAEKLPELLAAATPEGQAAAAATTPAPYLSSMDADLAPKARGRGSLAGVYDNVFAGQQQGVPRATPPMVSQMMPGLRQTGGVAPPPQRSAPAPMTPDQELQKAAATRAFLGGQGRP